ncbi:MAG TPA: hypothetical protein VM328_07855, partial [Fimbriimonadaceae bacterium]|nr:hypothetical protein [Fimbriimonadaceae bacterium]
MHRLQRATDPEARLAQGVFEKGHYGGRTVPTDTRQGTYALTPSGEFLGSLNSNDPSAVARMLKSALEKWNEMTPDQRLQKGDPKRQANEIQRGETMFPSDGLVLRVFVRDLPREKNVEGWRASAWNQDYLWYRKSEVLSWVPKEWSKGARTAVSEPLVKRLVKFNLVDHVR